MMVRNEQGENKREMSEIIVIWSEVNGEKKKGSRWYFCIMYIICNTLVIMCDMPIGKVGYCLIPTMVIGY